MQAVQDGLLTFEQVRARLNMSERFVREEIASGKLPAHRIGQKNLRIDPVDLEDYIDAHRLTPAPKDAPAPKPEAKPKARRRTAKAVVVA